MTEDAYPTEPAADPGEPAVPAADPVEEEAEEKEWWDDPRMPWKSKPGRQDIACWTAFALTGVYALVMLPLRPVIFAASPYVLAGITGSRTAVVTIGALTAVGGGHWWPVGLVLATLAIMKFDWIYFWAGKLWGRGLIEIIAGRSARSARRAAKAEALADKYGPVAVLATYILPLPSPVIYAAVGSAGMRWRTFLVLDAISAFGTRVLFMFLGYQIGKPAVRVVKVIADYSWYLSLAIIVGMILVWAWGRWRSRGRQEGGQDG